MLDKSNLVGGRDSVLLCIWLVILQRCVSDLLKVQCYSQTFKRWMDELKCVKINECCSRFRKPDTSHLARICTQCLRCFPYGHTCLQKHPCWLQSFTLPCRKEPPTHHKKIPYCTVFVSCCFSCSQTEKFLSATPNKPQHTFSKAH